MSNKISYLKAKHWIGNSYKEPIYQDKGIGRRFWRRWRRRVERNEVRKMNQFEDMSEYMVKDSKELLNDYDYKEYRFIFNRKWPLCPKFILSKKWRVCK